MTEQTKTPDAGTYMDPTEPMTLAAWTWEMNHLTKTLPGAVERRQRLLKEWMERGRTFDQHDIRQRQAYGAQAGHVQAIIERMARLTRKMDDGLVQ